MEASLAFIFYIGSYYTLLQCYVIFSIYFLSDFFILQKGDHSKKEYSLPLIYGIVFLLLFFARFIWGIVDFLYNYTIGYKHDIWSIIAYLFQGLGFGLLFALIHRRVVNGRDKYALVIMYFGILFMNMITFLTPLVQTFGIMLNIMALFIPLAYIYTAIKSTGRTRKKASYVSLGMVIYAIANALSFDFIREIVHNSNLLDVFSYLAIIFLIMALGCCFLFIGFKMKITLEDLTILGEEESLIKAVGLDLSKRREITEEEVSISKEKKICVVCKGKAIGFNIFICPNCETVYCQKCVRTISNLENTCWACNVPLDPSKPTKPYREETVDKIDIMKKSPKKT